MFFIIGVHKSFSNFIGKHLCWSLFLKNLQAVLKKTPTQVFSIEVCKIFKNTFFTEHLRWLLLHFIFFKKKSLNSYFATMLWRTNNLFFSTLGLMYKKPNSFAYKFVASCQVFLNNSVRVYPIKLKLGMLDHMNNTFRDTVF